ncbi:hypothetical protein BpHYR1_023774 [Brachionus plicatilis]|uniref:Uncharacterized protein n=1 Tax=Brachionus plicatilis TaxID=10195 RepID=A0A3M7SMX7_BRAPC|nr:hypothetical protein BpHYR1_023774 [Brachionus plicatilis]
MSLDFSINEIIGLFSTEQQRELKEKESKQSIDNRFLYLNYLYLPFIIKFKKEIQIKNSKQINFLN